VPVGASPPQGLYDGRLPASRTPVYNARSDMYMQPSHPVQCLDWTRNGLRSRTPAFVLRTLFSNKNEKKRKPEKRKKERKKKEGERFNVMNK
jgi:hypothetical protein